MSKTDFFTKEAAQGYDERNRKFAPISENLHFLMRLIFKSLPPRARILCAGAGTGAEIFALAPTFPEWNFVAVEPSAPMLEICRDRVERAGLSGRCEFVNGYVSDLPAHAEFDAALSILVAHFVAREQRESFYRAMTDRLRPGGVLLNAEISFDLEAPNFPPMLENWKSMQALMGGTEESLAKLPIQLKEVLTVLPPEETEECLRRAGIKAPVRFFQSFMISAWHGVK